MAWQCIDNPYVIVAIVLIAHAPLLVPALRDVLRSMQEDGA